jgi:hypothetical protein
VDQLQERLASIEARSTQGAKEILRRFSDHAIFPALISELETALPGRTIIGDIAIIDAVNALMIKRRASTPRDWERRHCAASALSSCNDMTSALSVATMRHA